MNNVEEKTILTNITDAVGTAADAVRPTVNAVTPWITWGVGQAVLSTAFAFGSIVHATPVVKDAVYRGTASALRKSKRAAKYTKNCVDEYCFGGVTYLSETARKEQEKKIVEKFLSSNVVPDASAAQDNQSTLSEGEETQNPMFLKLDGQSDEIDEEITDKQQQQQQLVEEK